MHIYKFIESTEKGIGWIHVTILFDFFFCLRVR